KGGTVSQVGNSMRFRVTAEQLAIPFSYVDGERAGGAYFVAKGLDADRYNLKIDGTTVAIVRSPKFGGLGLIGSGPEIDQAEKLRQTIIAKNELYFHRWRPQNVTYLFGFRKHEQGNNAVEIPQFDPLVSEKEKEIAKLRKPVEHVYELVPVKDKK